MKPDITTATTIFAGRRDDMTEWTPKVWPIESDSCDSGGGRWYNVGPAQMVGVHGYNSPAAEAAEALAAARLVAAAPALYDALCFAASVIKSGEPWTEACEKVIAETLRIAREGQ